MLLFWLSMSVLLCIAILFMAWPLWRYRTSVKNIQGLHPAEINAAKEASHFENIRLFHEHLAELENNLSTGAISAEQFSQLKVELERNLLNDEADLRLGKHKISTRIGVKSAAIFSAAILVLAVLLYQKFGSASDIAVQALQQEKLEQDYQDMLQNRAPNSARTLTLITEYQARVKAKPDNIQYWFLLARAQMDVNQFAEAAQSYQQILERDSHSSMIMAELAQAMFLRDGNKISPPVADLAMRAIALDPKNTMALGLAGISAFNNRKFRDAIGYWQRNVDIFGADSAGGKAWVTGIERAKQMFVAEGGQLENLTQKSAYAVQLWVSLGSNVKAAPDQTVFIYARAWQGSPMPLAIVRVKVSELPKRVTLDETMAMSPVATLANTPTIEVVARISNDGTAQTKVGDWQVKQGPLAMQSLPSSIALNITEKVQAENKP
jgi:cytochrome c-type biogenesis protein CcmH